MSGHALGRRKAISRSSYASKHLAPTAVPAGPSEFEKGGRRARKWVDGASVPVKSKKSEWVWADALAGEVVYSRERGREEKGKGTCRESEDCEIRYKVNGNGCPAGPASGLARALCGPLDLA